MMVYHAVVRGLTGILRKVTITLIPPAARSLAKRWLERQAGSVRTTENGSQSFHIVVAFRILIPKCYPPLGSNLALGGRSLHSATLPGSSPALAIDGDQGTCARTPRTEAQRWWQVALRKKASVRTVKIVTEGQVPALTVFVIELLEGNRTLYKPCGRHLGSHEG